MLNSDLSNKHKKFTEPELIIKESSYNYIELSLAEDEGSNLIDSYFIDYKVSQEKIRRISIRFKNIR